MKLAVIDTETSGLFDFSKPADAPGQPRLANLAIILLDENFEPIAEIDRLIKPDGWVLSAEAAAVNGLTMERLEAEGVPVLDALKEYSEFIEQGYIIVTYNAQFDTKVMRGEMRRAGLPDLFEKTPNICLMRASTNVCKIPKKTGKGFKFPKLGEACSFFKIDNSAAHTALGDAHAAVKIVQKLHGLAMLPPAEVHYAANRPDAAVSSKSDAPKEEAY